MTARDPGLGVDPGRTFDYAVPATMSDADLATEWGTVQGQDHLMGLAMFVLEDAAKAALSAALINLPPDVRALFDSAEVRVNVEWSRAGRAVANRYVDLEKEWLARGAKA